MTLVLLLTSVIWRNGIWTTLSLVTSMPLRRWCCAGSALFLGVSLVEGRWLSLSPVVAQHVFIWSVVLVEHVKRVFRLCNYVLLLRFIQTSFKRALSIPGRDRLMFGWLLNRWFTPRRTRPHISILYITLGRMLLHLVLSNTCLPDSSTAIGRSGAVSVSGNAPLQDRCRHYALSALVLRTFLEDRRGARALLSLACVSLRWWLELSLLWLDVGVRETWLSL